MTNQSHVGSQVLATTVGQPKNQAPLQLVLKNEDGTPFRGLTQAAHQNDSTAADIATMKTDFNALLAKLRAAGIMA